MEERREDRIGYVHVTQGQGVSKKHVVERKRNLTTTGLGKQEVKRSRSRRSRLRVLSEGLMPVATVPSLALDEALRP